MQTVARLTIRMDSCCDMNQLPEMLCGLNQERLESPVEKSIGGHAREEVSLDRRLSLFCKSQTASLSHKIIWLYIRNVSQEWSVPDNLSAVPADPHRNRQLRAAGNHGRFASDSVEDFPQNATKLLNED